MSKIGKRPVVISDGITVRDMGRVLEVKGKNATINVNLLPGISAEIKDKEVVLTSDQKSKQSVSNWGTTSAHLKNAIAGAGADFSKELSVVGIGFKVALEAKDLVLSLGFSHPVRFPIPQGVKITVEKNNLRVSGSDKWLVGETAAKIRSLKKPEPYQGKGIRYKDEVVRKKAGKKAATAAAAK